jgi:hypothetical protein
MAGRLSLLTPKTGALVAVEGVPGMHLGADLEEEGGLFDVINHPDYARNGWIYLAYSAAAPEGNTTVVDRARLEGARLTGIQRVFTALPYVKSSIHFGGRMALAKGYLFVTVGERNERERAQSGRWRAGTSLDSWCGRVACCTKSACRRASGGECGVPASAHARGIGACVEPVTLSAARATCSSAPPPAAAAPRPSACRRGAPRG